MTDDELRKIIDAANATGETSEVWYDTEWGGVKNTNDTSIVHDEGHDASIMYFIATADPKTVKAMAEEILALRAEGVRLEDGRVVIRTKKNPNIERIVTVYYEPNDLGFINAVRADYGKPPLDELPIPPKT